MWCCLASFYIIFQQKSGLSSKKIAIFCYFVEDEIIERWIDKQKVHGLTRYGCNRILLFFKTLFSYFNAKLMLVELGNFLFRHGTYVRKLQFIAHSLGAVNTLQHSLKCHKKGKLLTLCLGISLPLVYRANITLEKEQTITI